MAASPAATPKSFAASPVIPFPANDKIDFVKPPIPGARVFTILNALNPINIFGNVVIRLAIAPECFSAKPARAFNPPEMLSTTLLKPDTDLSDPKEPFSFPVLFPIALTAEPNACPTSFASVLKTSQYFPAFDANPPIFVAILSPSTLLRRFVMLLTPLIAMLDTLSNAGCNLLDAVSVKPSIACPTVLYSVANLVNCLFVPVFATASKKSSVFIFPS